MLLFYSISLHICGQVNTYEQQDIKTNTQKVRQVGFQETDIVNIAKPITKYAYKLKSADEIRYVLEKSYYLAQSGRPGPVLIDIPMNLQKTKVNINKLKGFKSPLLKKKNMNEKFKLLKKYLNLSQKPVLILGGGVKYSKSEEIINRILKRINFPIVSTWSGCDLLDHSNINYIGNIGVYGSRSANFTVQNSDLIISLGARLDTRTTGGVPSNFARNAKKVVVDIDKHELGKKRGLKIDIKFENHLNEFLLKFEKANIEKIYRPEWLKRAREWKKKYPIVQRKFFKQKKYVNPYVFIEYLSKILNKQDIIIADDGAHLTWTMQAFKVKYGQKLFSAFGNSPMGYSLPASVGASIANKNKKVICIDGDGSIQINIQELHTIKKLNLPIKIFILNNNGYGIIKQFQELYLGGRYEASGKGVSNPNFKNIAKAFGINYNLIENHKNLFNLKKILKSKKSEIIEILIKPNQKIIPKLQFGNPLEDMSPLLTRKEFFDNMDIPLSTRNNKIFEAN